MPASKDPSIASPYYPPRARWYSRLFYSRDFLLSRLPEEMTSGKILSAFFIPGLAFYFYEPVMLGKLAILLSGLLLAIGACWFGSAISSLALGLLVALHVVGFVYYRGPLFRGVLRTRLISTLVTLVAVCLLLYFPLGFLIQEFLLMPVKMKGEVVVIDRIFSTEEIQKGDWMAYELHPREGGWDAPIRLESGLGFGRVLALPGDVVEFGGDAFAINGEVYRALRSMPRTGMMVIPEKHWLIWPELDMTGHGRVDESVIAKAILEMAVVGEKQFLGKPFRTWFGRRQILS